MNGAVLIIGSLLWDDHEGQNLNSRKDWRTKRLRFDDKIHVKAPIRYGRKSEKTKTFTMVLSSQIDLKKDFGTAYVIPFKNKEIKSFRGIENQARFLSRAEGSGDDHLCKGINDKWCTIGLLFNPNFDVNEKQKILLKWEHKLRQDGGLNDFSDYCVNAEASILSNNGEILIPWLSPVDDAQIDNVNKLDFIIATCTKANEPTYPNETQLKASIISDQRKYFYNNIENGITTFQDRELLA